MADTADPAASCSHLPAGACVLGAMQPHRQPQPRSKAGPAKALSRELLASALALQHLGQPTSMAHRHRPASDTSLAEKAGVP